MSFLPVSENATIDTSIDWLSFTYKDKDFHSMRPILPFLGWETKKVTTPFNGYDNGFILKTGAIVLTSEKRRDMGCHIVLSGETLRNLAIQEIDAYWLIRRVQLSGGKFTRIDVAFDLHGYGISPESLYADFRAGKVKGRSKKALLVQDTEDGATLYVGSQYSDKFYRFYNKSAERRIAGMDWRRLEIILRSDYARALVERVGDTRSHEEFAAVARGEIKKMADFTRKDWQRALEGRIVPIRPVYEKKNKTREWLLTTVAQAMAKLIANTGSRSIVDEFSLELQNALVEHGIDAETYAKLLD